jgi:hypothetical protein
MFHHRDTEFTEKSCFFGLSREKRTNQNQFAADELISTSYQSKRMPRINHVVPSPAQRAGDLLGGSVFSPSKQNITLLCALRVSAVRISSV